MTWNAAMRRAHRWLSVVFTLLVAGLFAAQGLERWLGPQPAEWLYLLPLPPLACLLATGLYLFALPHVAKRRGGRTSS